MGVCVKWMVTMHAIALPFALLLLCFQVMLEILQHPQLVVQTEEQVS
jgi:hypothetical protein